MEIRGHFVKKATAAMAALIVFTLMFTGTFAWYVSTHAENVFSNTKQITPPELHDDFDPDTGLKNVYVENTGEKTIFVRIKLNEFLTLTQSTRPDGELEWETHRPEMGEDDLLHHEPGNHVVYDSHKYFTWHWGNEDNDGQKYYLPAALQPSENVFDGYIDDTTVYTGAEEGVKLTYSAQIISIDSYLGWDSETQAAFIGWVYDADGWAYWSQPLPKGEATGLLLASVDTDKSALNDKDYCYIIDVVMDAVDEADLPMWLEQAQSVNPDITALAEQASDEAVQVLNLIKGFTPPASPNM